MKTKQFFIIFIFALLITSCTDYGAWSDIEVINESSYNLKVIIEEIPPFWSFALDFEIIKGGSYIFTLDNGLGGKDIKPPNPNERVIKIIFVDLDTGETIIELDNIRKDTMFFEYITSEGYFAFYKMKITDDFCFQLKY